MLPRENRLSTTYEFNKTRRLGKRHTAAFFHIFYLRPRDYAGATRVGIVVSNKLCKIAARRNRLRRVFREIVRNNLGNIEEGFWIVLHPKYIALERSYEEVNSDFIKTLQTLHISK